MDEISSTPACTGAVDSLLIESIVNGPLLCESVGEYKAFSRDSFFHALKDEQPQVFNSEQKLGHLYEDVIAYVLESDPEVTGLQKAVQLFRRDADGLKRTVGEFDFLLNYGRQSVHLEVAVKFYMSVKTSKGIYWYGPDPRDHWFVKRDHMLQHQMKLSKHPEANTLLKEKGMDSPLQVRHLMYGYLFDEYGGTQQQGVDFATNALRGYWVRREQFFKDFEQRAFRIIPKYLWLCSASEALLKVLPHSEKEQLLAQSEINCLMVTDGLQNFFIVPDNWCDRVEGQ
ncbi:DUF1853 family protein [Akkermansiaceae bacterium]|nr:DUF1853 family protein [Akkermansiaceae bacterium]